MPELPEVETVKCQLQAEITSETVSRVEVRAKGSFQGETEAVIGKRVKQVSRIAKVLLISFEKSRVGLMAHLKMTGRLVLGEEYDKLPHTRVVIHFQSGKRLYFWDTRRFGWIRVVDDIKREEESLWKLVGPEPWDITPSLLWEKFQRSGRAVKAVLLDQQLMAGVGNIYANEALWKAGIDPRRPAKTLKRGEVEALLQSLREVLEQGLATGGASDNTYRNVYGEKGRYQEQFLVYGREGKPCIRLGCKGTIERVVIGGRGTWHCPVCQR